ncbi:MAG: TIGR02391 family protein [Bacteroidetes bacterium]|jgi:uncharacterized protein (TIGR02391 family)|nr:TIGR02391 family protein [Bacteroidota bacterium]MBK8659341.1 TIGR02391 family protein [Bacteroidota bacterium]
MKFLEKIDVEEDRIRRMKLFYQGLGLPKQRRDDALKNLQMFIGEFSSMIERNLEDRSYSQNEAAEIRSRTLTFLSDTFGASAALRFTKAVEPPKIVAFGTPGENVLRDVASMLLLANDKQWYSAEHHAWQTEQLQALRFMENCIKNYGLHSSIEKRDKVKFARYNVIVTFIPKGGKNKKTEMRKIVSKSVLEKEYLNPYASEKAILINGHKITHESISLLRITETLLLDDEIKLYEEKFRIKSDSEFAESCRDVTNELLPNPDSYINELSKELWGLVHPKFQNIVEKNFKVKQYAEAVRSVMIELNDIIKKEYKARTSKELDGAALMTSAFSVNNPTFKLADVSTQTGQNIQLGYMKLYEGSVIGIRNPVGHANISIGQVEAYEKIVFASHLLKVFEQSII